MTMLDRMRRHKNWLKWSLAIVVIAFVWLYIPSFMGNGAGAGNRDVVATVDGRDITVARFRRAYQQQMQQYRQAYGPNFDDRLLRQLGIEQRIVQQMIEEEIALSEAAAPRHQRQRRGDPGANHVGSRVPGQRQVRRRPAIPSDPAVRQPADAAVGLRGLAAPAHRHREAAARGERLDHRERQRGRQRVPAPQREGQACRRLLPRRQVPRGARGDRRGAVRALRRQQGAVPDSGEAEDSLRARRHQRAAPADAGGGR